MKREISRRKNKKRKRKEEMLKEKSKRIGKSLEEKRKGNIGK